MNKSVCSEEQLKTLKLKRRHSLGLRLSQTSIPKCFGPQYLKEVCYLSNLFLILKVISGCSLSLSSVRIANE